MFGDMQYPTDSHAVTLEVRFLFTASSQVQVACERPTEKFEEVTRNGRCIYTRSKGDNRMLSVCIESTRVEKELDISTVVRDEDIGNWNQSPARASQSLRA